jgi:uncharacterized membrane protein (DUF485 family)
MLWTMVVLSLLIHLLALIVFGAANLKTRLFPRLNWIPLAMGVLPLLTSLLLSSVSLWGLNWPVLMFALIFGVGWLTMGVLLLKARSR